MASRKTLTVVGIVAVLALATGAGLGFRYVVGKLAVDQGEQAYDRLVQTRDKLAEAKTARITFTSSILPIAGGAAAEFAGTTLIDFTKTEPVWTTDYTKVGVPNATPLAMTLVHTEDTTYVSSPGFVMSDKKPWTVPAKQSIYWPGLLARPDVGLNDFPVWLKIPTRVAKEGADLAVTKDLPDVPGASHEYQIICGTAHVACPPPFMTMFDELFTDFGSIRAAVWYDDDGRLHRLDISGVASWYPDPNAIDMGIAHATYGDYKFQASFTLDQFGTPVQVTAPPESQITTERFAVTLKS